MAFCSNCGAPLAEGAQFCARCGTAATADAAPPPRPATPPRATPPPAPSEPRKPRSTWWILPALIVGIVVVLFLLLTGMPFGGGDGIERKQAEFERIEERPAGRPADTGTIVDAAPPAAVPPLTTTTAAPTATVEPQPAPPPATSPQAVPPIPDAQRPTPSAPVAAPPTREPEREPVRAERRAIDEREAASILRNAATRHYRDVGSECIELRSHGYVNVGYTMTVWNRCAEGGIRMLGRWRVDARNGDVFRQREDGRYLAP